VLLIDGIESQDDALNRREYLAVRRPVKHPQFCLVGVQTVSTAAMNPLGHSSAA
jgi:hypothetical protein